MKHTLIALMEDKPGVLNRVSSLFRRRNYNVTQVLDVSDKPTVIRELALIKVKAGPGARSEIIELANVFRARIVDVGATSLTVEITGPQDRVNSLVGLLRPYGIEELSRTGRVAMVRSGNGDNAAYAL
jgi:acetolactate synthase-1/3 small subunit